jgi:N-acetylglucosamine-6-phosphate deacetylase
MDDGSRFDLAGSVVIAGELVEGSIRVSGGLIEAVEVGTPGPRVPRVDGIVAPGLCDLQVNGAGGFDLVADPASLEEVDRIQLAHGVTTYLPTIISTEPEVAAKAVRVIGDEIERGASPAAGIHLEGPFLNPDFRGIHRDGCLLEPDAGIPDYYRDARVRMVTLAPELPGAMELISGLSDLGVAVSIGHTGAGAEIAAAATARGAGSVTHLFNAMRRFHHREPNVPGWALVDERVALCVIPDGHHVDDLVLRLVREKAEDRVVLVSDSSTAAGAPDGEYVMGGVEISKRGDLVQDGRGMLAGSALALDDAVRRWMEATGASLAAAVEAASERPARLAGLDAGLRPGAPANLVVFDERASVRAVMHRGRWVGDPP